MKAFAIHSIQRGRKLGALATISAGQVFDVSGDEELRLENMGAIRAATKAEILLAGQSADEDEDEVVPVVKKTVSKAEQKKLDAAAAQAAVDAQAATDTAAAEAAAAQVVADEAAAAEAAAAAQAAKDADLGV